MAQTHTKCALQTPASPVQSSPAAHEQPQPQHHHHQGLCGNYAGSRTRVQTAHTHTHTAVPPTSPPPQLATEGVVVCYAHRIIRHRKTRYTASGYARNATEPIECINAVRPGARGCRASVCGLIELRALGSPTDKRTHTHTRTSHVRAMPLTELND